MILHRIDYKDGSIWIDKQADVNVGTLVYCDEWGVFESKGQIKHSIDSGVYKVVAQSPNLFYPNVPYLEIEEDIESLALQPAIDFVKIYPTANTFDFRKGFEKGYKSASAKKYTENDLEAAVCFGKVLENLKDDPYKLSDEEEFKGFIKSLDPQPISVEIDMKNNTNVKYIICSTCNGSRIFGEYPCMDCNFSGEIKTVKNYVEAVTYTKNNQTFLKVKKVNYE